MSGESIKCPGCNTERFESVCCEHCAHYLTPDNFADRLTLAAKDTRIAELERLLRAAVINEYISFDLDERIRAALPPEEDESDPT